MGGGVKWVSCIIKIRLTRSWLINARGEKNKRKVDIKPSVPDDSDSGEKYKFHRGGKRITLGILIIGLQIPRIKCFQKRCLVQHFFYLSIARIFAIFFFVRNIYTFAVPWNIIYAHFDRLRFGYVFRKLRIIATDRFLKGFSIIIAILFVPSVFGHFFFLLFFNVKPAQVQRENTSVVYWNPLLH